MKAGPERLYQAKAIIHYSKTMFSEQNRAVTQGMHTIKPEKKFQIVMGWCSGSPTLAEDTLAIEGTFLL